MNRIIGKGDDERQGGEEVPGVRARRLVETYAFLPDTWGWVPAVSDTDHVVAARLCDGEQIRAELVERLRAGRPGLRLDLYTAAAIWVPRRDSPEIQGVLQISSVVADEGGECTRDWVRSLLEPDQRTGGTVFSQTIEEVNLPAGPALVVREVTARNESPDSGQEPMTDNTIYSIFPTGSPDMVEFRFWTPALHLGDDLAADAAWIADTVEFTLGEPV